MNIPTPTVTLGNSGEKLAQPHILSLVAGPDFLRGEPNNIYLVQLSLLNQYKINNYIFYLFYKINIYFVLVQETHFGSFLDKIQLLISQRGDISHL